MTAGIAHKPSTFLAATLALALLGSAAEAACDTSIDGYTLDWDNQNWITGSSSGAGTSTAADAGRQGDPVNFSFSGNTDRWLSGYPVRNASFYGSHSYREDSLAFAVDFASNTQSVVLTINFSQPVEGLNFEMLDVDALEQTRSSGGFRDALAIEGTGPSGTVLPALSKDTNSAIYLGAPFPANYALGYFFNAGNGNDAGTLFVSFEEPVTSVSIQYSDGFGGYAQSTNPSPQGVALYDLNYCVPRVAEIETEKTQTLISEGPAGCDQIPGAPDPEAAHIVPGACIEYRITAENTGDGPADALSLIDELNPNLIYVGAVYSGFQSSGPGYGLATPAAYQDCAGGACRLALSQARLDAGDSGEIIIRAIVK